MSRLKLFETSSSIICGFGNTESEAREDKELKLKQLNNNGDIIDSAYTDYTNDKTLRKVKEKNEFYDKDIYANVIKYKKKFYR